MNLSKIFICRPVMTSLVMISILFFGIAAYFKLPVSDLPSIEYPTLTVTATYPGADPETMADAVSFPLERQFTSIEGIRTISSNNVTGTTTIVLQFNLNRSINDAATDVLAEINQALPNLPQDLPSNPTYQKTNPTASPIIYLAVASDVVPLGKLYDYGYSFIGQRLSMINGVEALITYGSPYAVRVQVDPDRLYAKEIGLDQIASALARNNPNLPTGNLYGPDVEYSVFVDGQIKEAAGYNSLAVRTHNGQLVRISELGQALDSLQNDKYSLYYQNRDETLPCMIIGILKQSRANAVEVIKEVKTMIGQMEKELPRSVKVITLFDESDFIFESVHDVQFTLCVAFTLVVIVVLFYLGKIVDTIIPILVLPLTVIGTFAMMFVLGYNLDILSLMAITLSIGFLVDDAIVVLENIVRHGEQGKTPFEASIEGSKQISITILSMTLCLASVFIPLLFMGGVIGRIFKEFGGTIITAVLFSGFISLTFTPLLCSKFTKVHHNAKKNWIEKISERLNSMLLRGYKRGLEFVIHFRIFTLLFGIGSVALTVFLFIKIPKDFLPPDDLGFIQGFTVASDGTSPFKTIAYQNQITNMLMNDPYVDAITAVGGEPNNNQGLFFVNLKPYKERKPMPVVIKEMLKKLHQLPGVNVFLRPYPLINLDVGTQTSKGNYQYTLQSLESEDLYQNASKLIAEMQKMPQLAQVTSDMYIAMPQAHFTIDRDRALFYNISAQAIENALGYAYAGGRISQINGTQNQYWVILETIPSCYKDPSVLSKLYISSLNNSPIPQVENNISNRKWNLQSNQSDGTQIPLNLVTKMKETIGPLAINHFNILPSVTISFNLNEKTPLGTALNLIDQKAAEILPPTVFGDIQGSASVFKEVFSNIKYLFLIALFIIYVILGILYENFVHPVTVMSVMPPAAMGGFLTLMIFGMPLSLYGFVGIMMLLGIVLKNGILMVDFANEAINEQKMSAEEAIKFACYARFRPIIMTTFAAIMGALPIALGIGGLTALSRRPLGLAVVGGLIFSQILTLFLTPVVFIYMEKMRESFRRKKKSQAT